jgi:hypothetical protein
MRRAELQREVVKEFRARMIKRHGPTAEKSIEAACKELLALQVLTRGDLASAERRIKVEDAKPKPKPKVKDRHLLTQSVDLRAS